MLTLQVAKCMVFLRKTIDFAKQRFRPPCSSKGPRVLPTAHFSPPRSPWTPHPRPQGPPKAPQGHPDGPPRPPLEHVWAPKWDKQNMLFYCSKTYKSGQERVRPNVRQILFRTPLFVFPSSALRFSTWLFSSLSGPSFVAFLAPLGVPGPSPLAQMYPFIQ
jgi:hypothetical protein